MRARLLALETLLYSLADELPMAQKLVLCRVIKLQHELFDAVLTEIETLKGKG